MFWLKGKQVPAGEIVEVEPSLAELLQERGRVEVLPETRGTTKVVTTDATWEGRTQPTKEEIATPPKDGGSQ